MAQIARVPPNADPIVRLILRQVRGSTRQRHLEICAGLGTDAVRRWHYQTHRLGPRIGVLRRVLDVLDYDLVVLPRKPKLYDLGGYPEGFRAPPPETAPQSKFCGAKIDVRT